MAPFALVSMPYKVVKAPQLFGPNILSELDSYTGDGSGSFRRGTGALALINKMTIGYEPGVATLNNVWRTANFSAQRSNSAYGNADTVQPQAMRALVLMRAY